MDKDYNGIAAVITAVGAIVLGVITYIITPIVNSWIEIKKEERTRKKIEKQNVSKIKEKRARIKLSNARIYGLLNYILLNSNADRVYIIQPHPRNDKKFISISLEVVSPERDVVRHQCQFQNNLMSDWGTFVSKISNENLIIYMDVNEIPDKRWRSHIKSKGVNSIIYKIISDHNEDWLGTLTAEYTHTRPSNDMVNQAIGFMEEVALKISEILIDYELIIEE